MASSVLRSRWLYVVLILVAGVLYVRFFGTQPMVASYPSEPAPAAREAEAARQMNVEPAQILKAGRENPGALCALLGLSLLALALGLGGLFLNGRALWRGEVRRLFHYRSRLPFRWPIRDLGRVVALLAFVTLVLPFVHVGLVSMGWMAPGDARPWGLVATVVMEAVLLLVVWAFAATTSMPWRRLFGLDAARAVLGMRRGLRGYVMAFPWIVALLWSAALLAQRFGIEPDVEAIHELLFMETRGAVLVLTLAVACVAGPIAEEVFFRGLVFSSLRRHLPRPGAMLISAALFSALHTNLIGFAPILVLGCVLADLYERTGSLAAPIAVHITHNTLLVGIALALRALTVSGAA